MDHQEIYQTPCRPVSVNQLIKSIIICELHALNDVALDTVERFAERLGAQLDVDRAVRLLADPNCVTNEYRNQLRAQRQQLRELCARLDAQRCAYERSTSWRITAPLRWTRLLLFGVSRQQPHIDD